MLTVTQFRFTAREDWEMHTLRLCIFSLLFLSLSVFGPLAAAATPDDAPPANESVCDQLIGGTPGLYGLCVAFCEAQDCQATYDEATGVLEFDPACKASDPALLARYNRRKGPTDPNMPCVTVSSNDCQCWTGDELYGLATLQTSYCNENAPSSWALIGSTLAPWQLEFAQATPTQCMFYGADLNGNLVSRYQSLGAGQAGVCVESLRQECSYRGF